MLFSRNSTEIVVRGDEMAVAFVVMRCGRVYTWQMLEGLLLRLPNHDRSEQRVLVKRKSCSFKRWSKSERPEISVACLHLDFYQEILTQNSSYPGELCFITYLYKKAFPCCFWTFLESWCSEQLSNTPLPLFPLVIPRTQNFSLVIWSFWKRQHDRHQSISVQRGQVHRELLDSLSHALRFHKHIGRLESIFCENVGH